MSFSNDNMLLNFSKKKWLNRFPTLTIILNFSRSISNSITHRAYSRLLKLALTDFLIGYPGMAAAESAEYKREERREGSKRGGHLISRHLDTPTSRHVTSRCVASTCVSATHSPRLLFTALVVFCSLVVDEMREPGSRALLKALSARLKLSSLNLLSANSSSARPRILSLSNLWTHNRHDTLKSSINHGRPRFKNVLLFSFLTSRNRIPHVHLYIEKIETQIM